MSQATLSSETVSDTVLRILSVSESDACQSDMLALSAWLSELPENDMSDDFVGFDDCAFWQEPWWIFII
jgi:hypothetical protein